MLFNLDRNLKHSILEEYKKEALLYEQRKQQEKQRKIKEEQEYLDKINKQEEEIYQKKKEEENIRKNNQMKYYQEILNSPDKNSRKKELIINNWGQSRKQSTPYKQNKNIFRKDANNSNNNNKYEIDYNSLSPIQKQKIYIRKSDDQMNKYLTDEQNKDELSKYLKEEKIYRQKYYKDLVNSQYEEAQRINKDRYGTNDILIIEKKRKNYFNENNISNKNYDFGKSNLLHNPIVNPENNITYNKYINFRLNKSNIFKTESSLKNLKEMNNNRPTLSLQTDEYSTNKRVVKIKDNNNYNIINNSANDIKNKLFNEENNNNDTNLKVNNYGRYSNDNIFDYRNKKNINENNHNRSVYEMNNSYEHKTNEQTVPNGSILSQAAKSNFLI